MDYDGMAPSGPDQDDFYHTVHITGGTDGDAKLGSSGGSIDSSDNEDNGSDGGYDWVKKKDSNKYIWAENVTSEFDKDLDPDYEYIGKTAADVKAHFNKNAGFLDKISIKLGTMWANIDYESYNTAKIKPFLDNVFSSYQSEGIKFGKHNYNNRFLYLDVGFDYTFPTENGNITASGTYERNNFNFVNKITFGKYESQGVYTSGKGALSIGNYAKPNIFVIYLLSKDDVNSVENYLNTKQ